MAKARLNLRTRFDAPLLRFAESGPPKKWAKQCNGVPRCAFVPLRVPLTLLISTLLYWHMGGFKAFLDCPPYLSH
ncbi:hypothetical protein MYCTH_2297596 [Thermothelomyces thermophilus ATCC 42464]|uniref:Uncharacterized protein n=1 Tax=Thermothelomyces thermophilus (strain ATCC 42464 / BCRC 31852 / DSM 1799) TaxID=573729 RepID=G2Q6F2_THET4|nr:uncharacterized protein MYCTH_2297596 [Thermothelomyces thermophilus ATCC 42464]AEO54724.1 hypothetical protein MYCTH_2297596 [Thermothelomyces thermophilus ATCC 42464]